jgi:hypothetical protein
MSLVAIPFCDFAVIAEIYDDDIQVGFLFKIYKRALGNVLKRRKIAKAQPLSLK